MNCDKKLKQLNIKEMICLDYCCYRCCSTSHCCPGRPWLGPQQDKQWSAVTVQFISDCVCTYVLRCKHYIKGVY